VTPRAATATRVCAGLLVAATVVAVVATVLLSLRWRPGSVAAFDDVRELSRRSSWPEQVRDFSAGALAVAAVVGMVTAGAAAVARRRSVAVLAAVAVAATGGVLALRNGLLWDQIAIRAVTVGTDIRGFWYAADPDAVVFVLVDGVDVEPGEYRTLVLTHTVVLPAVMVAAAVAAAWLARRPARTVGPATTTSEWAPG
jgi:quinol-cytochrome oxidoreductase complex cytochrome b subunit